MGKTYLGYVRYVVHAWGSNERLDHDDPNHRRQCHVGDNDRERGSLRAGKQRNRLDIPGKIARRHGKKAYPWVLMPKIEAF